jgi:exonuclease VII small subunit
MKNHWKLVIVLVIGMLVGSQIGPIRQALAVANTQIDSAIQQCHLALNNAQGDLRDVVARVDNLKKMPMTPAEQELAKGVEASAAAQKELMQADNHLLVVIEELQKQLRNK